MTLQIVFMCCVVAAMAGVIVWLWQSWDEEKERADHWRECAASEQATCHAEANRRQAALESLEQMDKDRKAALEALVFTPDERAALREMFKRHVVTRKRKAVR